jgi:L-alanine-DL-glutamate epimerase-like enolase superfamily enzyme
VKAWLASELHDVGRRIDSAQQEHAERREIVLRIEVDGAVGIGVGSPQPWSILGDAGFDAVWERLRNGGIERLAVALRNRKGFAWGHVRSLFGDDAVDRAVSAICESALLDLTCGGAPNRWATILGGERVEGQWTVGLTETTWAIPTEARRLRVKCDLRELESVSLERLASLRMPIILDANGSTLSLADLERFWEVVNEITSVVALEQAWGVGDFATPAQLRLRGARISHDETIRSMLDVRHASKYAAADLLCLKSLRLGGVGATLQAADIARAAGIDVYVGGFFESPLGRFRNQCVAQAVAAGPSDFLSMRGERVSVEEATTAWQALDQCALDRGETHQFRR